MLCMELTASCAEEGEVYAWGWKECVPSGKVIIDFITGGGLQKDVAGKQSSSVAEQGDNHRLCMQQNNLTKKREFSDFISGS